MLRKFSGGVTTLLFVAGFVTAAVSQRDNNGTSPAQPDCRALVQAGLGEQLFFSGDEVYSETIESYYAADVQDVKPWCILQPETTEQVSKAIKTLGSEIDSRSDVAIRSGGHSPWPSNNVARGVTIDLSRLNSVDYKPNGDGTGIASIGTGARWGDVYEVLEDEGVMTTGGREGHVGVGGFLLGGGFSWYSGKLGMSADNVISYEVVLADGSIVTVDMDTHADLFKALKGGMNNLGVVTRFDLTTFPSRDVYGGVMAFPYTQKDAVLQKFVGMIDNNRENPAEAGFVSYSWGPGRGSSVAFITANVDGAKNSTSFVGLEKLEPLLDVRQTSPVTGLAAALQSTLGLYNTWYTLSFHNTLDMGRKVLEVFDVLIEELKSEVDEEITVIFLMTPLPKTYGERGPNILGLDEALTANSIVFQAEALMPTTMYQDILERKLRAVIATIELYAQATGQDTRWRYVNYANPEQDPLGSYGRKNIWFLEKVSRDYDPKGFFQRRVSGGFKLPRHRESQY